MKRRASRQSSKFILYVRTGLMLGALFFVFLLIKYADSDDFKGKLSMIFDEPSLGHKTSWIWCPQGVQKIELLQEAAVIRTIESSSVLAQLCSIPIWALRNEQVRTLHFLPLLQAMGPTQKVLIEACVEDSEVFRVSGLPIRSKDLRKKISQAQSAP